MLVLMYVRVYTYVCVVVAVCLCDCCTEEQCALKGPCYDPVCVYTYVFVHMCVRGCRCMFVCIRMCAWLLLFVCVIVVQKNSVR